MEAHEHWSWRCLPGFRRADGGPDQRYQRDEPEGTNKNVAAGSEPQMKADLHIVGKVGTPQYTVARVSSALEYRRRMGG